jgi:serine/threonine protein kinase
MAAVPDAFRVVGGRFELERPLGAGERKQVYLARDLKVGDVVAVALIPPEAHEADKQSINELEVRVLGKLRGRPHIVHVYDAGEQDGWSYLVTQFMAGGDLRDYLRSTGTSPLPLADVLRIGREVCDALVSAQKERIIHRDVQPGNIWFDQPGGTAHLGDFDLAVAADEALPLTGELVTTRAYMPPEQATGGQADHRGDLYSFGATLYELTTGSPPFTGDEEAVVRQLLQDEAAPPSSNRPDIPLTLDRLICELLSKDPLDRPGTAGEVAAALAAIPDRSTVDPSVVESLIRDGEGERVEFKGSLRRPLDLNVPRDAWESKTSELEDVVARCLASFMNSSGGTLLIGIHDNGDTTGIESDYELEAPEDRNRDKWELRFRNAMKGRLDPGAAEREIALRFVPWDGATIALVECDPRSGPTYVRRAGSVVFPIRVANRSEELPAPEMVRYIAAAWPDQFSGSPGKGGPSP